MRLPRSLADGIALGASARSGDGDLGLVVFLAIMIHKIPASVRSSPSSPSSSCWRAADPSPSKLQVGLCTTLQADGLPRTLVRWGVGAFAAAAPAGAVLTYALVNLAGRVLDDGALQYWTGACPVSVPRPARRSAGAPSGPSADDSSTLSSTDRHRPHLLRESRLVEPALLALDCGARASGVRPSMPVEIVLTPPFHPSLPRLQGGTFLYVATGALPSLPALDLPR